MHNRFKIKVSSHSSSALDQTASPPSLLLKTSQPSCSAARTPYSCWMLIFTQRNVLLYRGDLPLQCAGRSMLLKCWKKRVDLCWITAPGQAISGYRSLTTTTTNQRPSQPAFRTFKSNHSALATAAIADGNPFDAETCRGREDGDAPKSRGHLNSSQCKQIIFPWYESLIDTVGEQSAGCRKEMKESFVFCQNFFAFSFTRPPLYCHFN